MRLPGANTKLIEERLMHGLRSARLPGLSLQLYLALCLTRTCLMCRRPSRRWPPAASAASHPVTPDLDGAPGPMPNAARSASRLRPDPFAL